MSFLGWKRSKTAEVGGCPGLEIDDSSFKNSPCSILENLGPCIALSPMRLRHTCKVATNAAETSIIGCVGCSRGSPHRRYSSVFCVSRSQKKPFWIFLGRFLHDTAIKEWWTRKQIVDIKLCSLFLCKSEHKEWRGHVHLLCHWY